MKSALQLNKAPVKVGEVKETVDERLVRLKGYLQDEIALFGYTSYAQDLRETIARLEGSQ